jgi:hypothetical protein
MEQAETARLRTRGSKRQEGPKVFGAPTRSEKFLRSAFVANHRSSMGVLQSRNPFPRHVTGTRRGHNGTGNGTGHLSRFPYARASPVPGVCPGKTGQIRNKRDTHLGFLRSITMPSAMSISPLAIAHFLHR